MRYIKIKCEECGCDALSRMDHYVESKNHFCSRKCHMRFMNRELNKTRMNNEVKEKIRQSQLGRGNNLSYEKCHGRHTHRVVAEKMLGRPLKPGEIVHHIDGNKRNNDPSNLMVMTQSEHCKLHFSKNKGVIKLEPLRTPEEST